MPSFTVRNIPDDVHRAIRARAALHGRSTEAEIRAILELAAKPADRVKLGSLLVSIGRDAGLTAKRPMPSTSCAARRRSSRSV